MNESKYTSLLVIRKMTSDAEVSLILTIINSFMVGVAIAHGKTFLVIGLGLATIMSLAIYIILSKAIEAFIEQARKEELHNFLDEQFFKCIDNLKKHSEKLMNTEESNTEKSGEK